MMPHVGSNGIQNVIPQILLFILENFKNKKPKKLKRKY